MCKPTFVCLGYTALYLTRRLLEGNKARSSVHCSQSSRRLHPPTPCQLQSCCTFRHSGPRVEHRLCCGNRCLRRASSHRRSASRMLKQTALITPVVDGLVCQRMPRSRSVACVLLWQQLYSRTFACSPQQFHHRGITFCSRRGHPTFVAHLITE